MTVPNVHLEMSGSEIVITMPGTNYIVTYYRPQGSRHLLAKRVESSPTTSGRHEG